MINKKMLPLGAFLCLLFGAEIAHADFALNWAPDLVNRNSGTDINGNPRAVPATNLPYVNCNRGEGVFNCRVESSNFSAVDPDRTPFLQEIVRGTDGNNYYHVIVGLPDTGFAQETFIRANGSNWPAFPSVQGSSAGGTTTFQGFGGSGTIFNNQRPLDADESINGNSTGNPTRVVMRQINSDAEFSQEFLKDTLLNKPRISQVFNSPELTMTFVSDMRGLLLTDMSTAAAVVNTLNLAQGGGSFDMARDAQPGRSQITAGQYQWLPGAGPDQSGGTYQYSQGGYDPYLENWKAFRDPLQNPVIKNP